MEDSRIPPAKSAPDKQARRKKFFKELREWIIALAVAALVVMVIRTCLFMLIRVDGTSMETTLLNGERLFVTVPDLKLGGAERGDVVICRYPNRGSTHFVKRVVALPGDVVYRENGVTHVVYSENGATVDESLDPSRSLSSFGAENDYPPYTLGEDEYFVVGDNRYASHDSRDWNDSDPSRDVGPITGDMLLGRVHWVVWPPSNFRTVE